MNLHNMNMFDYKESISVRSLVIRSSLGGMKFDVGFLQRVAKTWHHRFTEATKPPTDKLFDISDKFQTSSWNDYIKHIYSFKRLNNATSDTDTSI
eukprot:UN28585